MPSAARATTPVRWPDHEETFVEGDAYVAEPGHRPRVAAGTSVVELRRASDLRPVMEAIGRNLAASAETAR